MRVSTPVSCQTTQSAASMQPVGGGIDVGRFVEDLRGLGEEPLRGDLAAVAVQPGLAGRPGGVVDAVGLGLGGVVLPELDPGMRLGAQRSGTRHSGVPSAVVGSMVQAVKSMPDADDIGRVDAAVAEPAGTAVRRPSR